MSKATESEDRQRDSASMRAELRAVNDEMTAWVAGCRLRRAASEGRRAAREARQAAIEDGMGRQPGESLSAYVERILGSHGGRP
jgi:hypothetical protein